MQYSFKSIDDESENPVRLSVYHAPTHRDGDVTFTPVIYFEVELISQHETDVIEFHLDKQNLDDLIGVLQGISTKMNSSK